MKSKHFLRVNAVLVLLIVSVFLYSCSSGTSTKVMPGNKDQPEWVMGSLPKVTNTIFAVGTANIGANSVLARRKAEEDARQEIGRITSTKVKSFLEKVVKENMDLMVKDEKTTSSTETVNEITSSASENVIAGIEITDRWEDTERSVFYALAKVKSEDLKNAVVTAVETNKNIIPEKKESAKQKVLDEFEKFNWNK